MARILVANIDNENMLADERAFTDAFCRSSAITAGRMAWFAEPGDIVVLPRDLSPAFKAYMARLRGRATDAVAFVTPDWPGETFRPLGSHELLRLGLPDRLKRLMRGRRDWTVLAYCHERGAQLLAEALDLNPRLGAKPFLRQGGAELLNDKRVFRSLAAGRGVALAEGVVVHDEASLAAALGSLIDRTGTVIVKQDRHSGGLGNLIVSREREPAALGARDVITLDNECTIAAAARAVWARLAYVDRASLVVEAYLPTVAVATAEFRIDADENAVSFLDCGEVRQAPILSGLVMPWSLSASTGARFIAGATELARLCCDLGYDGLVNVDGIVTADGAVVFNEFNGRIGGCSHIHHILATLAGPDYAERLVVASHSRDVAVDFARLLDAMAAQHFAFDAGRGAGIVITAEDCGESGFLEYLSVAPTREQAFRLEAAFESLLDRLGQAPRDAPPGLGHLASILAHLPGIGAPEDRPEGAVPPRGRTAAEGG